MGRYDFAAQPSILIQGAMETETGYLAGRLREPECVAVGNWRFYTGFLGTHAEPVIVSQTYQGLVNAAAATSLALVRFRPRAVINQGICGGHDPQFHRGDIVLGERIVPMGAVVRGFSGPGEGIDEADFEPLRIEIYNRGTGRKEKVWGFPCDGSLLAAAERVGAGFSPDTCFPLGKEGKMDAGSGLCAGSRLRGNGDAQASGQEASGQEASGQAGYMRNNGGQWARQRDEQASGQAGCISRKVRRGVLGSADEWNNQADRIALLRERYHTAAEDMESAAAAQLCLSYGIPFIGIRILSNSIVNGEEFDESVAEDCQIFVEAFVEELHFWRRDSCGTP